MKLNFYLIILNNYLTLQCKQTNNQTNIIKTFKIQNIMETNRTLIVSAFGSFTNTWYEYDRFEEQTLDQIFELIKKYDAELGVENVIYKIL